MTAVLQEFIDLEREVLALSVVEDVTSGKDRGPGAGLSNASPTGVQTNFTEADIFVAA
jgi:hypothetical protein